MTPGAMISLLLCEAWSTMARANRRGGSGKKASGWVDSLLRPLSRVGANREDRVGRILANPLADYYLILLATAILVGLGVIMVGSASSVWSANNDGDPYHYLNRQVFFLALGLPAAFICARLKPNHLAVAGMIATVVSIILLILIITPLGVEQFGNRAWLRIFGFRVQPSEFAKVSLILYSAMVFANRPTTLDTLRGLFIPVLPLFAVVEGLIIFVQHDMGTAMIIGTIFFAMLWFVGAPFRVLGTLGAISGVAMVIGVVTNDSRLARVIGFLRGDNTLSDQPLNALYGLASGGWWGVGLGGSRQKWGGLYNAAMNDYVLAVLGEEMGLIGVLLVLVLFLILLFAGLRAASRSTSAFMRYATSGVVAWIAIQAVINIFVVFGLLPVVGVPLPFISQGGSALLANLIGVGILISAARREPRAAEIIAARSKKGAPPRMTTIVDTGHLAAKERRS